MQNGIYCINVDSWEELDRIETIASKHDKIQSVSIQINPELNFEALPHHHHHHHHGTSGINFSTKTGLPISDALEAYSRVKASSSLRIKGISCYASYNNGSLESYLEIRDKLLQLADDLRQESKICVEHIDFGAEFSSALLPFGSEISEISNLIEKVAAPILERGLKLILEPGRNFLSDIGVLMTKIEYIKTPGKDLPHSGTTSPRSGSFIAGSHLKAHFPRKTFAIVDAGFNDFMLNPIEQHPHCIIPIQQHQSHQIQQPQQPQIHSPSATTNAAHPTTFIPEFRYEIVGPICEAFDIHFKDLILPHKLKVGDLLIISDVGSYGYQESSLFKL